MSKKILLFDFDGTIADTLPIAVDIINKHGSKYGIKYLTPEAVKKLQGMTPKEAMGELKIPLFKLPFFLNKIRGEVLRRMDEVKIFDGMKNALSELKKDGYPLVVVTSSPREHVERFIKDKGMSMFDRIHSNKNIFGKASTLKSIINDKNNDRDKYIYIGDEVRDIEACKKNNLTVVVVTWGFNSREILTKYDPDIIVSSPEELIRAIKKLS